MSETSGYKHNKVILMVQANDILSALEVMGVYLPNYGTEEEKLSALVAALEALQVQVKTQKDAAAAAELERQRAAQIAIQLEDKTMRIRMKADELMEQNSELDVADALIQAAQIIKEENLVQPE